MKLFLLIWLPWSWKSTYIKNKENSLILSSDEIRKELFNNINEQNFNKEVFSLLHSRTEKAILENKYDNIYIDATNLSKKSRRFFLLLKNNKKFIKNWLKIIWVNFVLNHSTIIEQDSRREKKVWKNVINKMICNYVEPDLIEGFDEIIEINRVNELSSEYMKNLKKYLSVFEKEKLDNKNINVFKDLLKSDYFLNNAYSIEQTSQYHIESLWKHLELILNWISWLFDYKYKKILLLLNIFHDIWKPFSRMSRKDRMLRFWADLIREDIKWNFWIIDKKWKEIKVENFFDFQFIWHEQVSYLIYNREYSNNLINYWIIDKEEDYIIKTIIKGHLNFHKIEKEKLNEIKIWNDFFYKNEKLFKIGILFSKYDSEWRIVRK